MTVDWDRVLSKRVAGIAPVYPVEFERLLTRADLVLFAGGTPPVECLPRERLDWALHRVWQETEPSVLEYGEPQGYCGLREFIAERMAGRGAPVPPEQIIVTNGSQQGIDLVAEVLLDPGDRVVIEAPTYFGALQTFDVRQPEYVPVPIDDEGLIPDALERALRSTPRPKLIYTIPTFQNPTGVTLSPARRRALVALSSEYNVPIVEDDPYGELRFHGTDLGPVRAIEPDVIYLGTFSKTLAPALRLGWMAVPEALRDVLVSAKEGVDIQSDRMLQRAIPLAASDGWFDAHLDAARAVYRSRCDHILACLEDEMPAGVRWTRPEGGFFIWVTLPGGADADALLRRAAAEGVAYIPGSFFYPGRAPRPSFRLGFSTLPEERAALGIQRLGRVLRQA